MQKYSHGIYSSRHHCLRVKGISAKLYRREKVWAESPLNLFVAHSNEPSASLLFFCETKLSIFFLAKTSIGDERKKAAKKKKKNEWLRLSLQVLLLTKLGILAGNFSYLIIFSDLGS